MLLVLVRGLISSIANLVPSVASTQWLKNNFPPSLYLLCKQSGISSQVLKEYVVCPKCHSMYDPKMCCFRTPTGTMESNECQYIQFPNHRHRSRRVKCNTILMKTIKQGSNYKLIPQKVYLYDGVSLRSLLMREGILKNCNQWRNRKEIQGVLADITDGQVWKIFCL